MEKDPFQECRKHALCLPFTIVGKLTALNVEEGIVG
jgi:hypothetical protein